MSHNNDGYYQPPYSSVSSMQTPTRTPPPIAGAPTNPSTAIFNAILQDNVGLIRSILNQTNYDLNNLRNKDGKTPLMVAACENCPHVTTFLCQLDNLLIDLQNNDGDSALHQASAAGNIEIVEILINANACVDLCNNENITPLIVAAYNGHADVCRILIDLGHANIDFQDNSHKAALTLAAYEGHAEVIKVLLARGANVNIIDEYGWTALMLAAFSGHSYVCYLLLENNANRHVITRNGKTAVVLAREANHNDTANLIENYIPGAPPFLSSSIQVPVPDVAPKLPPDPVPYSAPYAKDDFFNIPIPSIEDPYSSPKGFMMPLERKNTKRTLQPKNSNRHKALYVNIDSNSTKDKMHITTAPHVRKDMAPRDKTTLWVYFSWIVTACCINPFLSTFCRMKDPNTRQAWREKVALCFIILFISLFIGFLTFGFTQIACKIHRPLYPQDILRIYGPDVPGMKVHIIRGRLYNTGVYFSSGSHRPIAPFNDSDLFLIISARFGQDISDFFPPNDQALGCKAVPTNASSICNQNGDRRYHCHTSSASNDELKNLDLNLFVGYTWDNITDTKNNLFVYKDNVYDLNTYLNLQPNDQWLGNDVTTWLSSLVGRDATMDIMRTQRTKDIANCFDHFLVGKLDGTTLGCVATSSILILMTVTFISITLIKFISAVTFDWFVSWQLGKISKIPKPDNAITYLLILVTCYSEGEQSMRTTLDSLAETDYSDKHKVLFVIADGNITGSDNNKSTPQICKDLLEPFDPSEPPPEPKSYHAIGDGLKQHNMAEVSIGYYVFGTRRVPMCLVNKVGTKEERKGPKAGNRGKRDSQLILMKWLSHVCFDERLTPLEFELFEKIHTLTGVTPNAFEMILMVDADTCVKPDSISHMVAAMERDPKVMGLCGETKIANKTDSWVTMIQVFEYYISHHLGKPFESIFGGVTCLPGCFCMYRIKVPKYGGHMVPILANPDVVEMYASNTVETLHQKNLLLLGEDRYLTTLMLRTFPKRKMIYVPKAICKTVVPDKFQVLLSQRRRWINSTIHNLMELILVPQLCGIFCCSMQFGNNVSVPLIFIASTYFLQAFLIVFTSPRPAYIIWMIVFIFSTPIWYFVLPLYAFWHFDDFSWGATRKITGGDSGHGQGGFCEFDSSQIPMKKWAQWKVRRISAKNLVDWYGKINESNQGFTKPQKDPLHGGYNQMNSLPPPGGREKETSRREYKYTSRKPVGGSQPSTGYRFDSERPISRPQQTIDFSPTDSESQPIVSSPGYGESQYKPLPRAPSSGINETNGRPVGPRSPEFNKHYDDPSII
ncbi:11487_t:CDS:2 [Gigaspora rosea]|nr:11487_t:CDS:2 [Gigaspora rosea]